MSEVVTLEDLEELDLGDPLDDVRTTYPLQRDPSKLGFPPTLPMELALRTGSPKQLCADYGISAEEWAVLCKDENFKKALKKTVEDLKEDGGLSFRMKAQLQSEELLKTSWRLIHSPKTPATVKGDLIKFTIRAAGLDHSKDVKDAAAAPTMSININLP